MNKQNVFSIACAFFVVLGLSVFLFAQTSVTPEQEVDQNKAILQALQALTAAQERQAAAWEKLAEKGWPTPQNNTYNSTFAGGVPRRLNVTLSGQVGTSLSGNISTCEI
jgi:hypothetical protein